MSAHDIVLDALLIPNSFFGKRRSDPIKKKHAWKSRSCVHIWARFLQLLMRKWSCQKKPMVYLWGVPKEQKIEQGAPWCLDLLFENVVNLSLTSNLEEPNPENVHKEMYTKPQCNYAPGFCAINLQRLTESLDVDVGMHYMIVETPQHNQHYVQTVDGVLVPSPVIHSQGSHKRIHRSVVVGPSSTPVGGRTKGNGQQIQRPHAQDAYLTQGEWHTTQSQRVNSRICFLQRHTQQFSWMHEYSW